MAYMNVKHYLGIYKTRKEMQELMQSPDAMTEWFKNKRKEFDALPDNN